MNSNLKSFCIFIIYVFGAIACFAFFQFCYPYHLYYQEQNQLFLASWDYLTTYLEKPGWLACMAGDFLTQFYLYRFMGATILTLCILLAGQMCGKKGRYQGYMATQPCGIRRDDAAGMLQL